MTAYVSYPITQSPGERRICSACHCGQIAARNETDPVMPWMPVKSISRTTLLLGTGIEGLHARIARHKTYIDAHFINREHVL